MSHTPGPWVFDADDSIVKTDYKSDVIMLGRLHIARPCRQGEQTDANARLIAAAPDLLSALERIARNFELLLAQKPVRDVSETLAEVNAAIDKATGEK